jgi:hypothetical protein
MPFLAPIKGGIKQGAEQLILCLTADREEVMFAPDAPMLRISRGRFLNADESSACQSVGLKDAALDVIELEHASGTCVLAH